MSELLIKTFVVVELLLNQIQREKVALIVDLSQETQRLGGGGRGGQYPRYCLNTD